MIRRDLRFALVVLASAAVLLGLLVGLTLDVGRPYPGFFFTANYRVFPVEPAAREAGLVYGDRIVRVDGDSPLTLMPRVRCCSAGAVRYEVERDGRRFFAEIAPHPFTWSHLIHHFGGYFVGVSWAAGDHLLGSRPFRGRGTRDHNRWVRATAGAHRRAL